MTLPQKVRESGLTLPCRRPAACFRSGAAPVSNSNIYAPSSHVPCPHKHEHEHLPPYPWPRSALPRRSGVHCPVAHLPSPYEYGPCSRSYRAPPPPPSPCPHPPSLIPDRQHRRRHDTPRARGRRSGSEEWIRGEGRRRGVAAHHSGARGDWRGGCHG